MWAPDYVTEGELAAHVRIGDSADDAVLALAIATASRAVDRQCGRQFGRTATAEARTYVPRWSRTRQGWRVPIDDLLSAPTLVEVDTNGDGTYDVTVTTSTRLRPSNADTAGVPWTELLIPRTAVLAMYGTYGPPTVRVTGSWGWPGIPDGIRQATLLQASRLVSRRDSPFGIAGSPEAGSELRLLARLDPDVATSVEPYRRRVWAA